MLVTISNNKFHKTRSVRVHFFHAERRANGLKDTAKLRVDFRNCFAEAPRRGIHSIMIMDLLSSCF